MAIRIEQPGAAKAAAAAGTAIGKGQRAKEDRASAERKQAQTAQRAAQQKTQQVAMDWELQKMQMRSQQEFEQELADKQWDYERFNRAKAWDIEKLELRSRMDFQQEEQERLRQVGELDNQINAWNKAADDYQVDRDFAWQNKLTQLEADRDAVKAGIPLRTSPDRIAKEQAANREVRAQESAQRAQEAFITGQPTDEAIRRKRVLDLGGSAYRDVPLDEAEAELRGLGLVSTPPDPSDVDVNVSPEELKASAVGKPEAEKKLIYERGVKLGYWN